MNKNFLNNNKNFSPSLHHLRRRRILPPNTQKEYTSCSSPPCNDNQSLSSTLETSNSSKCFSIQKNSSASPSTSASACYISSSSSSSDSETSRSSSNDSEYYQENELIEPDELNDDEDFNNQTSIVNENIINELVLGLTNKGKPKLCLDGYFYTICSKNENNQKCF